MADSFTFLPFARPSLISGAQRPSGAGQRLLAPFAAEILADGAAAGAAVSFAAGLRGAGDMTGFDPSAIAASDPDDRTPQFETNYLPYVEFAEPDFPWRYTLDTGGPDGRLQPWLLLVALKPDEFDLPPQGDAPLPRLRVLNAGASLPAVADGRFVAHVHLPVGVTGAAATAALSQPGARARLLCHRRLEEGTAYALFLVPAYEQGCRAGLGEAPAATPFDAPAWTAQAGAVDLPFYWWRRFVTNAGEDIETLIRRLRALPAADVVAIATPGRIDAATPGHYGGYVKAGAEFTRRAATNAPGTADPAFATDPALAKLLAATLAEAISGEVADETRDEQGAPLAGNDPLVVFPAYGWRFREERALDHARPERYWFDRLNLDLPFRDAAQRGAVVVRKHQDAYMRVAWAQYGEIVQVNRVLLALQASERLARRMAERRLDRLPPDVALSLAEPLLRAVPGRAGTVADVFGAVGAPASYASRAIRRIAAKRMRASAATEGVRASPAPSIPGDRDARGFGAITRTREALMRRAGPMDEADPELRRALIDALGADLLNLPVPRMGAVAVSEFRAREMTTPVAAFLRRLPRAKAEALVTGRSAREAAVLAPVFRSPVIPDALADRLREIDPGAILPGLSDLPDDTVSFFEENRAFIEAAMVGANHEMNAELRWRGFPTDMRGTVFRRFWQRGLPPTDPNGDDIGPIHTWRGALGTNPPSHDRDQAENLIMVIKGEIVRKVGLPVVEINVATGSAWAAGQGTTYSPIFMGRIGDAAYFAFDISRDEIMAPDKRERTFLVISEPPGRLRFGLDIATQAARASRRDYALIRAPFPIAALAATRSYSAQPRAPAPLPAAPAFVTWDDFSWSHVRTSAAGYLDFTSTPAPQSGPDHWGAGKSAASVASSLWQRPIAAILPLQRVL